MIVMHIYHLIFSALSNHKRNPVSMITGYAISSLVISAPFSLWIIWKMAILLTIHSLGNFSILRRLAIAQLPMKSYSLITNLAENEHDEVIMDMPGEATLLE